MPDRRVGNAWAKHIAITGAHAEQPANMSVGDDDIAADVAADQPAGTHPRRLRVVGQLDTAHGAQYRVQYRTMALQGVQQTFGRALIRIVKARVALVIPGFGDETVIDHLKHGPIPMHDRFKLSELGTRVYRRRDRIDRIRCRNNSTPGMLSMPGLFERICWTLLRSSRR